MNKALQRECISLIEALNDDKMYRSIKKVIKDELQNGYSFRDSKVILRKTKRSYDYRFNNILKKYNIQPEYIYDELDSIWGKLGVETYDVNQYANRNYINERANNSEKFFSRLYFKTSEKMLELGDLIKGDKERGKIDRALRSLGHFTYSFIGDFLGEVGLEALNSPTIIWRTYMNECLSLAKRISSAYMNLAEYKDFNLEELDEKLKTINKQIVQYSSEMRSRLRNLKFMENAFIDEECKRLRKQIDMLVQDKETIRVCIDEKKKKSKLEV